MTRSKMPRIPKVTIIPEATKKFLPGIGLDEHELIRKRSSEKLLFSFKYLDTEHEAFNLGNIKQEWFLSLFEVLKELSDLTRHRLAVELRPHYRSHEHDWGKAKFKYNFVDDFLNQVECTQFCLSKGTGRVHGFIIGNRFYVIWLDPHHNMYPMERVEYYPFPATQYEILEQRYSALKMENATLELEIKELEELVEAK